MLPSQGGREVSEDEYKQIVYKVTEYRNIWANKNLSSSKLFTGGLFSCLKLHQQWLFAGMLDGLIKLWDVSQDLVRKPLRIFEGHEERVTSLDTIDSVLVSGSLDHSVRVWNIESSSLLRVLRGSGSPVLFVKLLPGRLAWWSRSGTFQIWSWKGPENIELRSRIKIDEDPTTCNISIGDQFIAVAAKNIPTNSRHKVVIFSSHNGKKEAEKNILISAQIQCMDIQSNLLFLCSRQSIEVWNIENSACVAMLAYNDSSWHEPITSICVSDFQLVATLGSGNLLHWPLTNLIKSDKRIKKSPLLCSIGSSAYVVLNTQPVWGAPVMSDNKIVFGLEIRFGEVKIFNWRKTKKRKSEEEEDAIVKKSKTEETEESSTSRVIQAKESEVPKEEESEDKLTEYEIFQKLQMKEQKADRKRVECTECGLQIPTNTIKRHRQKHEKDAEKAKLLAENPSLAIPPPKPVSTKKKVPCPECGKQLPPNTLKRHIAKHKKTKEQPKAPGTPDQGLADERIPCSQCEKMLPKNAMKRHLMKHETAGQDETDGAAVPLESKEKAKVVRKKVACQECGLLCAANVMKRHLEKHRKVEASLEVAESLQHEAYAPIEITPTKEYWEMNEQKKTAILSQQSQSRAQVRRRAAKEEVAEARVVTRRPGRRRARSQRRRGRRRVPWRSL